MVKLIDQFIMILMLLVGFGVVWPDDSHKWDSWTWFQKKGGSLVDLDLFVMVW